MCLRTKTHFFQGESRRNALDKNIILTQSMKLNKIPELWNRYLFFFTSRYLEGTSFPMPQVLNTLWEIEWVNTVKLPSFWQIKSYCLSEFWNTYYNIGALPSEKRNPHLGTSFGLDRTDLKQLLKFQSVRMKLSILGITWITLFERQKSVNYIKTVYLLILQLADS